MTTPTQDRPISDTLFEARPVGGLSIDATPVRRFREEPLSFAAIRRSRSVWVRNWPLSLLLALVAIGYAARAVQWTQAPARAIVRGVGR